MLDSFSLSEVNDETPVVYDDDIPARFRRGLVMYFEEKIEPGHFLTAVLNNDLRKSFSYADSEALEALPEILRWLENYAPSHCWGAPDAVEHWTE